MAPSNEFDEESKWKEGGKSKDWKNKNNNKNNNNSVL